MLDILDVPQGRGKSCLNFNCCSYHRLERQHEFPGVVSLGQDGMKSDPTVFSLINKAIDFWDEKSILTSDERLGSGEAHFNLGLSAISLLLGSKAPFPLTSKY